LLVEKPKEFISFCFIFYFFYIILFFYFSFCWFLGFFYFASGVWFPGRDLLAVLWGQVNKSNALIYDEALCVSMLSHFQSCASYFIIQYILLQLTIMIFTPGNMQGEEESIQNAQWCLRPQERLMQGSIRNSICFFYPNLAVFRICEEVAL
jgi:hypothetical protein